MVKPVTRILANSTALTISVFIEKGLAFLLPWYVARVQGRTLWGYYSTALTFITIASPFAFWGLQQLLPREIARDQSKTGSLLTSGLVLGTGISVGVILSLLVGVRLLNYPPEVQSLIYYGILTTLVPYTGFTLFEAALSGLERMGWIIAVRLPLTLVRVVISVLFLSWGYGMEVLFAILAGYYVLACGTYFALFSKRLRFPFRLDWMVVRRLFVQAVPFVAVLGIGEAFKQMGRVVLSKAWSTDSLGIYTAGTMVVQLLYLVAPAVMTAVFPLLVRSYQTSAHLFAGVVSKLFKFIFVIFFPIALGTIALADYVILSIYGQDYVDSIAVMQITALGIVPSFVTRLLYRVILASNNERASVRISFVNSFINLALSSLLIPRYGIIGASIINAFVEVVGLVQNLSFISRKVMHLDISYALLKPCGCVVAACLVYWILEPWHTLVAWSAASVIFVGLLFMTKTVVLQELRNINLSSLGAGE
jgi:O-antigen/teichoic acid export membrane protein